MVAMAIAAPSAAAASGEDDLGAYRLQGDCGLFALQQPGFTLTAGPVRDLPVGTTVLIVGDGVASIGRFTVSGGSADANVVSPTAAQFTLIAPLPAGARMAFRTSLSSTSRWKLDASVTVPDGYVGSGAKTTATVASTLQGCVPA